MDDHMLKDIGLRRGEIEYCVRYGRDGLARGPRRAVLSNDAPPRAAYLSPVALCLKSHVERLQREGWLVG
jgi:hypothetical protein